MVGRPWIAGLIGLMATTVSWSSTARIVNVWADDPSLLDVQIVHSTGVAQDATEGQDLGESDRIRTGYKSHARLDFGGKATVVLGELSEFEVSVFKLGATSQVELWLKAGEVQAQVRKESDTRTEFAVRTPTDVCKVRGTEINFILYTPESKTWVAMGLHGSLHAGNQHGFGVNVSANQRVHDDNSDQGMADDSHLRLADVRTLTNPNGFTFDEIEATKFSPMTPTSSINSNSNGSSTGALAPGQGNSPLPSLLLISSQVDQSAIQLLSLAGFKVFVSTDPSVLGGSLQRFAEIVVNGNASSYTSNLQAFHDANKGVVFTGTGALDTFKVNLPLSVGSPIGVQRSSSPSSPVPTYLGSGSFGANGSPTSQVTAAGSSFTGGAVPAGTVVNNDSSRVAIAGGTGQVLANTIPFDSIGGNSEIQVISSPPPTSTAVYNADGKGRAGFTAIDSSSSTAANHLSTAIYRQAGGLH